MLRPILMLLALETAGIAFAQEVSAIKIDKESRTVAVACKIAPRKLPNLSEVYPLEVIATYPSPQGQKAHETVVVFDVKPSDVHKALEGLGLAPGKPAKGAEGAATGPPLALYLELPVVGGATRRMPIEKTLVDRKTGKAMPALKWFFTGSVLKQPDPEKNDKVYGADVTGTLISIFPVTDETVIQSHLSMKDEPLIKLETDKKLLPPEGTPAVLLIMAK
jgi:hypothetical protein